MEIWNNCHDYRVMEKLPEIMRRLLPGARGELPPDNHLGENLAGPSSEKSGN